MGSLVLYYVSFAISAISAEKLQNRIKNKLLYYMIVLFVPVFIATTRVDIGTDYMSYYWYYQQVSEGNVYTSMEFLYKALNYVAHWVFGCYEGVLFLSAALTYSFVLAGLRRIRSDASVGIGMWVFYCFYFSSSLNVMRQLIALSIVFYALILLNEGKMKKSIIFMVIATLFHTTSLIAFVFIFVKLLSKSKDCLKKFAIVVAVCSMSVIVGGGYIIRILAGVLPEKYKEYFLSTKTGIISLGFLIDIIPTFLIVIIPVIFYVLYCRHDKTYRFLCNVGMMSLPILLIGYYVSYFGRIVLYFDIAQIALVGVGIKKASTASSKLLYTVFIVLFYGFYFWYSAMFRGSNEIIPYMSSWFGT